MPLIFRHGAAETAFTVALVAWLVFEFAGRMIQRLALRAWSIVTLGRFFQYWIKVQFAATRKRLIPGVW